jgi:hypothetical protein
VSHVQGKVVVETGASSEDDIARPSALDGSVFAPVAGTCDPAANAGVAIPASTMLAMAPPSGSRHSGRGDVLPLGIPFLATRPSRDLVGNHRFRPSRTKISEEVEFALKRRGT